MPQVTQPSEPEPGLTREQLDALRRALETKRDDLRRATRRHTEVATQAGDQLIEEMDLAARATTDAEMLGLAAHERALLGEIEHALGKIADGTYGASELSGEPIPFARLQAIPWARTRADEAEIAERRR